jgi:hypothetical protein
VENRDAAPIGPRSRKWDLTLHVKDLRECQEFLSRRGAALRAWETRKLDDSNTKLSAETCREYVDLVGETRLHATCLPVR